MGRSDWNRREPLSLIRFQYIDRWSPSRAQYKVWVSDQYTLWHSPFDRYTSIPEQWLNYNWNWIFLNWKLVFISKAHLTKLIWYQFSVQVVCLENGLSLITRRFHSQTIRHKQSNMNRHGTYVQWYKQRAIDRAIWPSPNIGTVIGYSFV